MIRVPNNGKNEELTTTYTQRFLVTQFGRVAIGGQSSGHNGQSECLFYNCTSNGCSFMAAHMGEHSILDQVELQSTS